MKELINFLILGLIDKSSDVNITVDEGLELINVNISVPPEQMGRVIGKEGKTINAIRALAKVLATKSNKKLLLSLA